MYTICFTGRRPKDLCGYNREAYADFMKQLKQFLKQFLNHDEIRFISGGAQGFDQLAFWTVNELKTETNKSISNDVFIPFTTYQKQWPEDSPFGQNDFKQMLQTSDSIYYVVQKNLTDYPTIVKALMQRNQEMIDASDMVIALYPDETWKTSKGGTAAAMKYASKKNKPIYQVKYIINRGKLQIASTERIGNA